MRTGEADGSDIVVRFMAACSADVRVVLEPLRRVTIDVMRGIPEIVYHGALAYTPTGKPGGRIVYLAPKRGYVNLGFFFATALADPHRLLEGTGRRMRHVKVRTASLAEGSAVRQLLEAARTVGVRKPARR